MGTFQSKHACKRRESPEGGTFSTSPFICRRELDTIRDKQDTYDVEQKDDHFLDHDCPLEVILPPERATDHQSHKHTLSLENEGTPRRSGKSEDMQCNTSVMDENRQEWVFTLYDFDNSGRVTKEDMSSLMHTICEVVEASVKNSALSNGKTLRVKLTVTPSTSCNRRDRDLRHSLKKREQLEENHPSHLRGQTSDPAGNLERKLYRVDENTERRNHYLDLAGIENYTSKFEADNTLQSNEDQCQESLNHGVHLVHLRRPQTDSWSPGKSSGRGISFLRSLRSRSKSMGASGATGKPSKLHSPQPVSWSNPPLQQQPSQHSHNKRVRIRPRDVLSHSMPHPSPDWDLQPGTSTSPAGLVPVAQRHEHHHLHEHHHHHHHHHYYSS
ncbi:naked cuticle-like protein 3 [Hoplias malabaricus]|uniref:naked cuticle-like protein 3 n=1 Tax=Hoplias malabaricus TaxID=27720 RepID=UPI003462B734